MHKHGDIFVLGDNQDTQALLRLTRLEAPGLLSRMVIIDPAPAVGAELHGHGLRAIRADPADVEALTRAGIGAACLVVCLAPDRLGRPPAGLEEWLRPVCPGATVLIGPSPAVREPAPRRSGARWLNWRVAALLGLAVLDGLVLFVPVTATALLVGALLAPRWLRGAARFLDALADGR